MIEVRVALKMDDIRSILFEEIPLVGDMITVEDKVIEVKGRIWRSDGTCTIVAN